MEFPTFRAFGARFALFRALAAGHRFGQGIACPNWCFGRATEAETQDFHEIP